MATNKILTNDKALRNLEKRLKSSSMLIEGIHRERLLNFAKLTRKAVIDDSSLFENGLFHPNYYIIWADLVIEELEFNT